METVNNENTLSKDTDTDDNGKVTVYDCFLYVIFILMANLKFSI